MSDKHIWIRETESQSRLYVYSFDTKPIARLDKIQYTKGRYLLGFHIPNTDFFYEDELDKICDSFEEAEYIATNRIKWHCNNLIKKIMKVKNDMENK